MTAPDFREFLKVEEAMLAARLRAVRAAIEHRGEKGRGLEHHAIALLREMLPHEYGLATGFIAHAVTAVGVPARVQLTAQCDVIIFDAVRGAPIVNLGSSQVVPIESVYAAVEVKAAFDADAHRIAKWSAAIKQLTLRHYVFHEDRDADPAAEGEQLVDRVRAQAGAMSVGGYRAVISPEQRRTWEPPLTFALAFEYGGGREPSLDAARERLATSLGQEGHLDGLLIPGSCALWSDGAGAVEGTKEEALATWRYRLVSGLSSFPRPSFEMTPDLRPYFGEYVLTEPVRPSSCRAGNGRGIFSASSRRTLGRSARCRAAAEASRVNGIYPAACNTRRALPTMDHDGTARARLLKAIERLDPAALASIVGGLLLVPENLHHTHRFEVLANLVLAGRAAGHSDVTRTKARTVLDDLLGTWTGRNDDPWPNLATEAFVYHGGNHVFIPGGTDRVFVLRSLARTIETSDGLPRGFVEAATRIIQFGCVVSDDVLTRAGLAPNLGVPAPRGVVVPPGERLARLRDAVGIAPQRFAALCADACIRPGAAERFCLPAGAVPEPHPMESFANLQYTPLARLGSDTVVVAPHLIADATIRQVLALADEMGVRAVLADEFHLVSFLALDESLGRLGLKAISPPRASFGSTPGAHVAHILFQCDRDKLQHVMLVGDALDGGIDKPWEPEALEVELAAAHAEYTKLMPRFEPAVSEWSSMVVCAPIGRDCELAFALGSIRICALSAADCETIAHAEQRDPLLLWKYQIALDEAQRSMKVMSFAPLDTYATWRMWGRRLVPNNDRAPGFLGIATDSGETLRRDAALRRGWRALPSSRPDTVVEVGLAEGPERPIYVPRGSGRRLVEVAVETAGPLVWFVYDPEHDGDRTAFERMLDIVRMGSFWVSEFADELRGSLAKMGDHPLVVVRVSAITTGGDAYVIERHDRTIDIRVGPQFTETYDDTNAAERRFAEALLVAVLQAAGTADAAAVVERASAVVAPPGVKRMLHAINAARNPAFVHAEALPDARHVQDFDAHRARRLAVGESSTLGWLAGEEAEVWLKGAVTRLYTCLRAGLAEHDPRDTLDDLLRRYEALVLEDEVRDLTFASVLACAERTPTIRRDLEDQIGRHARAASATRFLIEHIVAEPPTGTRPLSVARLDELLAIAAEIILLGSLGDVARYKLASIRVCVGINGYDLDYGGYEGAMAEGRGQRHAERLDLEGGRIRVPGTGVGANDAHLSTAPPLPSELEALNKGARAEFGRGLQDLAFLFGEALALAEERATAVVGAPLNAVVTRFSKRLGWPEAEVNECLAHFLLGPRASFTSVPAGYRSSDIWPWTFNRGLSYIRRPFVLSADGTLLYTSGHVMTASENLLMLLTTARYQARTKELRAAMDAFVQTPSRAFAEDVGVAFRERGFVVRTHVAKIGSLKIEQSRGHGLGDVDVLVADRGARRVIAIECKDLQVDRMPHEMSTDLQALFVGSKTKTSAQDRHLARLRWLEDHRAEVVRWLVGVQDDGWRIEAAMVLSRALVTPYLGQARLPVWTIRQVRCGEAP